MSRLFLNKVATPATPAAGKVVVFVDTADGRVKSIDENGAVHFLTSCDWGENLLFNGAFDLAQRQAPGTLTTYSNTTGRAYGADRWGMTNENASIQFQRVDSSTTTETGLQARMYGKFKKLTSAGKIIVSQVLEASNTMALRGRPVRLQAKMRYTVAASMTVRLGLLYLTNAGTIDTIPATFVSAFGAGGTDPTWGANLTALAPGAVDGGAVSGLGMSCVLTANWVRYSAVFTVPSNCKNLIAVIWSNGQLAANDELNITEVGLYDGQEIMDFTPRPLHQIIQSCERYYQKTFDVDTAPAQNAGVATGALRAMLGKAAATALAAQFQWKFRVPMRNASQVFTTYNPAAANAQVRQIGGTAADLTATATANPTANGVDITATGAAGGAVGDQVGVHVSADNEL